MVIRQLRGAPVSIPTRLVRLYSGLARGTHVELSDLVFRNLTLMFCLLVVPASALGQGYPPPSGAPGAAPGMMSMQPQPELAMRHHWYGWQIIMIDVANLAIIKVESKTEPYHSDSRMLLRGLTTYALGGPIVHAAHGNWGRAGISLGVRTVLPATVLGLSIAAFRNDNDNDNEYSESWDQVIFPAMFTLVAMAGAAAIDASALSIVRETPPLPVVPTFAASKGRATFGLAATF